MLDNYGIRTDLALEATERFTEENVEVRGVEIHEDYNEEKDIRTTVVKITTENGARTMGRIITEKFPWKSPVIYRM